jgi:hypothetical protein
MNKIHNSNGLTEKDLSRRLIRDVMNAPETLIAGVCTALSGASLALFSSSSWLWPLVGITCISATAVAGIIIERTWIGRKDSLMTIIKQAHQESVSKRNAILCRVSVELTKLNHAHGQRQLLHLETKFSTFTNVLNMQFDADELTHKRYLTIAEQLYFGAIDQLHTVVRLQHSLGAIDVKHLEKSLSDATLSLAHHDALKQRLAIASRVIEQEAALLTSNEQIMTKLDEVTSQLSSIQTREGLGTLKLDSAMREIQDLILRTNDYNIN